MLVPSSTVPTSPVQPLPLIPEPPDLVFRDWCAEAGILVHKKVGVITSPRSVAGRGVFALENFDDGDSHDDSTSRDSDLVLAEGDPVAFIPSDVIFCPSNAASYFPTAAEEILQSKIRLGMMDAKYEFEEKKFDATSKKWLGMTKSRLVRFVKRAFVKMRKGRNHRRIAAVHSLEFTDLDALWQPELTHYASATKDANHPWREWMDQWRRDDPTYALFETQTPLADDDAISDAAHDLMKLTPFLSHDWLVAALKIRLGRWEEQQRFLDFGNGVDKNNDDKAYASKMYELIGSRAATLCDNQVGVIPFHDMINHSLTPNLDMLNDEEGVKLFANRDIKKGEELFLSYVKLDEVMDETNALWAIVQWGIPTQKEDVVGLE